MMNLEERVKEAMQEEGKKIVSSPHLKRKIILQVTMKSRGNTMKKRILTTVLAAALLVPTSAFAYKAMFADEVYGSFDNVKKHIASATLEGYMRLDGKLATAQGEMSEKEYEQFMKHLKVITDSKLKYGNDNGSIDYDQLSEKKKEELLETSLQIQPYFDQLNGEKSSKEVLTEDEYVWYIKALMTYETMLAKSGSSGSVDVNKLSVEDREEFLEAERIMEYVNGKVQK
ncbi:DUF3600 domain-containing protein [Bacillus manliponensis]